MRRNVERRVGLKEEWNVAAQHKSAFLCLSPVTCHPSSNVYSQRFKETVIPGSPPERFERCNYPEGSDAAAGAAGPVSNRTPGKIQKI